VRQVFPAALRLAHAERPGGGVEIVQRQRTTDARRIPVAYISAMIAASRAPAGDGSRSQASHQRGDLARAQVAPCRQRRPFDVGPTSRAR